MWPRRWVGRGIALLFHDRGIRRGWVISSTPRPHFTLGKDLVPVLHKAGWAPGPVWTGGKSRPNRDSIPDRPARNSIAILTELPDPLWETINFWKGLGSVELFIMNSHTNIMRGWVFEGPVHETLSVFLETVQSLQCSGYNVSKCMCLYSESAGGVGYYCRQTQQLLFPSSWSYLNTAGNSGC